MLRNLFGAITLEDTQLMVMNTLRTIASFLGQGVDASGRLRVITDSSSAIGTVSTVTTVTTVTTVSTVSNITSLGGYQVTYDQIYNSMQAFQGIRSKIS